MFTTVRRAAVVATVVAGAMVPTVSVAVAQDDVAAAGGRIGPWWSSAECYEVRAKYEGRYWVSDCYENDKRWWFNYA